MKNEFSLQAISKAIFKGCPRGDRRRVRARGGGRLQDRVQLPSPLRQGIRFIT